jgi:hypothetical protein
MKLNQDEPPGIIEKEAHQHIRDLLTAPSRDTCVRQAKWSSGCLPYVPLTMPRDVVQRRQSRNSDG